MARFADDVETGRKGHSIRARRKHPIRVGDKLMLYTGMRQKCCRKLLDAVCTKVEDISIEANEFRVCIDGRMLSRQEIELLAVADGFSESQEFFDFFAQTHGSRFEGDLIHWKPSLFDGFIKELLENLTEIHKQAYIPMDILVKFTKVELLQNPASTPK